MFVINHLFFSLDLEDAYKRACEEGSKEVFLARMNLVGFHEAGKTSLAKRLMGKDFDANVKSTEGVSIHHIKSNFNKSSTVGEDWNESEQDASELNKLFIDAMRKYLPRASETEQHLPKLQPGHVQGETKIPERAESNRSVEKAQQSTRPKQVKMSKSTKKRKETNVENEAPIPTKKVKPESGLLQDKIHYKDEKSNTNIKMSEKFQRFALMQIG